MLATIEDVITAVLYCLLALGTVVATTPTPVLRYPCGLDRCVVNQQYCSHEDSPDEQDWLCVPCSEERHRCEKQITKVPPACFGYCEVLKSEVLLEAAVANLSKQHGLKEEMMLKETSDLEKKLESMTNNYNQLKRISITPSGTLDQFLVDGRWFTGVIAPLALLANITMVVYLVRQCILRRKRRPRRRDRRDNETGVTEPLRNCANENHTTPIQEMRNVAVTVKTQTDVSGLGLKHDPELLRSDQEHRVEFSQPSDKGAHGVRVLPKATDHVDRDGKAGIDDTAFLNIEPACACD